jgi:hypothetical protein
MNVRMLIGLHDKVMRLSCVSFLNLFISFEFLKFRTFKCVRIKKYHYNIKAVRKHKLFLKTVIYVIS